MKCYFTYQDGVKYLIPHCMAVVHSDDIEDCICADPLTEHQFQKERFNKVLQEKNETIKILLAENETLLKELNKLTNDKVLNRPNKKGHSETGEANY